MGSWFSVRCLFRWNEHERTPYEERITLWWAKDLDEAISLAEREAAEYAETQRFSAVPLVQAYALDQGAKFESGIELFSLLRDSDLAPEQYVEKFFDTGNEHQSYSRPAAPPHQ